ncbi:hypothetical protein M5689_007325 [Euphorbia peplus]|nr:hypothetical protein M5689_007325 [Euphorbia peplus]
MILVIVSIANRIPTVVEGKVCRDESKSIAKINPCDDDSCLKACQKNHPKANPRAHCTIVLRYLNIPCMCEYDC